MTRSHQDEAEHRAHLDLCQTLMLALSGHEVNRGLVALSAVLAVALDAHPEIPRERGLALIVQAVESFWAEPAHQADLAQHRATLIRPKPPTETVS